MRLLHFLLDGRTAIDDVSLLALTTPHIVLLIHFLCHFLLCAVVLHHLVVLVDCSISGLFLNVYLCGNILDGNLVLSNISLCLLDDALEVTAQLVVLAVISEEHLFQLFHDFVDVFGVSFHVAEISEHDSLLPNFVNLRRTFFIMIF